ncbi:hypothetical protein MNB_SM-3-962 [hydrothermal vent metagenome]|uniref:HlyD family secretion protein n=1 Tax=hydrothermal vent metagenome TaxID=652676 RepID=A0A1W1D380_9ZZZZ
MKILFLLVFATVLFGKEYYAKVEPYEMRKVSSKVAGEIVYVNEYDLGNILSSKPYIKIDDSIDKKELISLQKKEKFLQSMLQEDEDILQNIQATLKRKQNNYDAIKGMKIKSQVEKDGAFYDLIATKNQLLNTKKSIANLETQISNTKLLIIKLRKKIKDKSVTAKGFLLYSLLVKPQQVVGIGTPLALIADISKAKLLLYLDKDDVYNAKHKVIYINGKKTNYKITRLIKIADTINISKYQAQIIIDAPKIFSNLVKVELKDE